jgi:pterin-4a-carbinolamine dehydratase
MKNELNHLLLLNSLLVEQANSSTLKDFVPLKPSKREVSPIVATTKWENNRQILQKTFRFSSIDQRNSFVTKVLYYETEKGHNALINIAGKKVSILLTTHKVNKVTELDIEYSKAADLIEKEVKLDSGE